MYNVFFNLLERVRVEKVTMTELGLTTKNLDVIFNVIDSNLDGYIDHYEVSLFSKICCNFFLS